MGYGLSLRQNSHLETQHVYYIELNEEVGLLTTTEQGSELPHLRSLLGQQSQEAVNGKKNLLLVLCAHSISIHTWTAGSHAILFSLTWGRLFHFHRSDTYHAHDNTHLLRVSFTSLLVIRSILQKGSTSAKSGCFYTPWDVLKSQVKKPRKGSQSCLVF